MEYLVNETIVVVRSGKRVKPTIGKKFDFTDDEIKQLKTMRPQAISVIGNIEADVQSVPVDDEGGETVDLSKMTKAELLELAAQRDVAVASNASKADIIAALQGGDDDSL